MKVKLVCQDSLAAAREYLIESFPCDLGRGLDVHVRIDDRWLSRRHCRLEVSEGVVVVRDLASRHGTLVNGQRVTECKLMPGDRLSLGLTHLVAEYEAPAADSQVAEVAAASSPVLA